MILFQFIPLLVIPYIIYVLLHLIGAFPGNINVIMFNIPLPSGAIWRPTYGDSLIILGILILFVELFKATRATTVSIIDHIFSTLVLMAYLITWLIAPWAGNSYFLILSLMSFLDVIAGFTITISTAKRDFAFGDGK